MIPSSPYLALIHSRKPRASGDDPVPFSEANTFN